MNGFEGSFLGRRERIGESARLECGVCWWIYDPARGDDVWQIPPGTAFAALPEHWRCPNCDAAPEQFMVLGDGGTPDVQAGRRTAREKLGELRERLLENYRRVALRMRGLAVCNSALGVAVPALREAEQGPVAVLTTPWCMNLLLFADDAEHLREGSVREHAFPSGSYPFTASYLQGVGHFEACSLFSPMDVFEDQRAALAVARETMEALFRRPADAASDESTAEPDRGRRRFLGLAAKP